MLTAKRLPHKTPQEKIKIFLKRHWFIFFVKTIFHLFLIVFPVVVFYLIGDSLYSGYTSDTGQPVFILIVSAYFLSVWLFLAASILNDFLDYWIVTDNRVISINQSGLFSRTIAELKMSRIQDVTSEVKGFFPTFLHYGNIYIQSAGTAQRFVFRQVPHATHVAQDILHLVEIYKSEHRDEMMVAWQEAQIENAPPRTV